MKSELGSIGLVIRWQIFSTSHPRLFLISAGSDRKSKKWGAQKLQSAYTPIRYQPGGRRDSIALAAVQPRAVGVIAIRGLSRSSCRICSATRTYEALRVTSLDPSYAHIRRPIRPARSHRLVLLSIERSGSEFDFDGIKLFTTVKDRRRIRHFSERSAGFVQCRRNRPTGRP